MACELDRGHTDAASGAVDQQGRSGCGVQLADAVVRGGCRDRQRGRVGERQAVRLVRGDRDGQQGVLGVTTGQRVSEDRVPDFEPFGTGAHLLDHPGRFAAEHGGILRRRAAGPGVSVAQFPVDRVDPGSTDRDEQLPGSGVGTSCSTKASTSGPPLRVNTYAFGMSSLAPVHGIGRLGSRCRLQLQELRVTCMYSRAVDCSQGRNESGPRYASIGPARPPATVDPLFAGHGHELGRTGIYRTRLHPHAQSQVSSRGADSMEYVPAMSGQATGGGRRPSYAGGGGAARSSGPSSHYCTTQTSLPSHPRRIPARLTAPTIRSGIDFDSTAHGYVPVGPHSAAACGRLVLTAPPGSPYRWGGSARVLSPPPLPPHCGPMKSSGPAGARRQMPTGLRTVPVNGDDCAGQRPRGELRGNGATATCSGLRALSTDSAAGVDGLRSR